MAQRWFKSNAFRPEFSGQAIPHSAFRIANALQIFQLLQFGTQILIGVILAKSGFPTGEISLYETLFFLAALACFYWVVGGQNALLQVYPSLDEEGQKRSLFNVFLFFILAAALTAGLVFGWKNALTVQFGIGGSLPHLDWLAWYLLFNSPAFLAQIYLLLLKKERELLLFGAVSFSLQLLAVAIPLLAGQGLEGMMMCLTLWASLKFCYCVGLLLRYARCQFDPAFCRKYLPLLLPLLLLALVGKGTEHASSLMAGLLAVDEKAFAVFRYGARELPLAVLMTAALTMSLLPQIAEKPAAGLHLIKSETARFARWLYPLSMAGMLVSPLLFPLIFNGDFKESARVFNIFTLLLSSRMWMSHVVLMGYRKNYVLTVSAVVELLALIGLSWWLGSRFGMTGIAWAAVLAFFTDRVVQTGYCWRVLKIRPSAYTDVRGWAFWNAALLGAYLMSEWIWF